MIYKNINNDLIMENEILKTIEELKKTPYLYENIFKENYIYARVSSLGQKEDLERQKNLLQTKYPNYKLITDIGSGMNLNRTGLRKIIDKYK